MTPPWKKMSESQALVRLRRTGVQFWLPKSAINSNGRPSVLSIVTDLDRWLRNTRCERSACGPRVERVFEPAARGHGGEALLPS
jgi:hypothetical protein